MPKLCLSYTTDIGYHKISPMIWSILHFHDHRPHKYPTTWANLAIFFPAKGLQIELIEECALKSKHDTTRNVITIK